MKLISRKRCKLFWVAFISGISLIASAEDNPCGTPPSLLSLVNRPTVSDSPCVVPYKNAVVELGYQYLKLFSPGYSQNFPEADLRLGLPASTEFIIMLPNYVHQTVSPSAGFSATGIGIKHQIGYSQQWVYTVEGIMTLPSGSTAFGSNALGGALNGIVSYDPIPAFNLTCQLGITSQTQSSLNGGQRFNSINPDVVISWSRAQFSLYGEIYGQSKTAPHDHSGFNMDTGLIYLLKKNITLDAEIGQRISGTLGGFNHYIGAGMAILL